MATRKQYKPVAASDVETATVVAVCGESNRAGGTDTYFDGEPDVLAVFAVDYDNIRNRLSWSKWIFIVLMGSYVVLFSSPLLNDQENPSFGFFFAGYFIFLIFFFARAMNRQMKNVHGVHVAVTRHGIRKDCNRFPFGSIFRTTTIMPFDEIEKIIVRRGCCGSCSGKKTSNVFVYSKHDSTAHAIGSLKDPDAFVELVKTMMSQTSAVVATSIVEDDKEAALLNT